MRRVLRALVIAVVVFFAGVLVPPAGAHYYDGCQKDRCKSHVIEPFQSKLRSIATCESHRDWDYNGSSGFDGGLQFSPRTWSSLGSPYAYAWQAPAREQKYRAVILRHRIGCWRCTAGWPNCG